MLPANEVWNTALLEAGENPFDIGSAKELHLFSSRHIRRQRRAVHTRADPFLFVRGEWLYLFLEAQAVGRPGHIEAHRTRDLERFEPLGPILASAGHFSYPLVFESQGRIHMVPESSDSGEVALYTFDDFPRGLRKERVLLSGRYLDSTLWFTGGLWWLFTTSADGLELYFAPNLAAAWQRHPASPITRDPASSRCGGPIVEWQGAAYRLAQNGTERYGGNLSVLRIEEIGAASYRESPAYENIFDRSAPWRSAGAHHLSMARFGGRTILAVDGKQRDYKVNRLLSPLFRAFG